MSVRRTRATALRVLRQLRHDPRTVALLLLVPCVLQFLMYELFQDTPGVFQSLGVPLLGLFPFVAMFIVTSITMLRERVSGPLERLLTTPLGRGDLLVGYGIAFALIAAVQASLVSTLSFGLLGLESGHRPVAVVTLAIANAVLGMALASSRARSRGRSSRRFSSCPPSCSRRSSSAGSSCRATRWRSGSRLSRRCSR